MNDDSADFPVSRGMESPRGNHPSVNEAAYYWDGSIVVRDSRFQFQVITIEDEMAMDPPWTSQELSGATGGFSRDPASLPPMWVVANLGPSVHKRLPNVARRHRR